MRMSLWGGGDCGNSLPVLEPQMASNRVAAQRNVGQGQMGLWLCMNLRAGAPPFWRQPPMIATDPAATYLADQRWIGRESRSSAARPRNTAIRAGSFPAVTAVRIGVRFSRRYSSTRRSRGAPARFRHGASRNTRNDGRAETEGCAGRSVPHAESFLRIHYGLGGLIMTWAPGVPGYISQGPLSGAPGTPRDSGVAYGV